MDRSERKGVYKVEASIMRKGKDEKLGALFREYIGESEAPPPQVIQAAKQALEEQSVAEFAEEPVAVAAGGRGHFTPRRKAEIGVLLAVVVCAAALLVYYLLSQFVFSAGTLSLDWTQLDKVSAEYTEKEFVPFVKENSVTQYDEFLLNEDSPYYEEYEGEIVLYYVQYESYGIIVDLFIEIDGFSLDALEGYEEIEDDYPADDLILYIELDDISESTYVYFAFDVYQYFFEIHTLDEDLIYAVLEEIVFSF